jgi:hypothetical protein
LLFTLVFFPFLASGVHIFGFNDSFFRDTIGGRKTLANSRKEETLGDEANVFFQSILLWKVFK